jgi:hypothetical protein
MAAYTTVYTDFMTGNKLSVTVTYQNGDYTTQVTGQFDQRCDVVQYDAGQLKRVIESTYMLAVNSVTGSPPSASATQAYVNQAYADAYAACAIGDAEGLDLSSVTGAIHMAADIAPSDVILQADSSGDLIIKPLDTGDSLTIQADLTKYWWGVTSHIGSIGFADGTVLAVDQPGYNQGQVPTFTWIGSSGTTTLTGSNDGANVFELGAGVETVTGGTCSNTYHFGAGSGQAVIQVNGSSSSTNELDFGNGITDNELWFRQLGNDLQIDLLGTSSEVTVRGWFASTNNQLQEITAGGLKLDTQVSQLVQAMAIYSAANAGFDPTQAAQIPSNSGLQGAVAAAWHL